MSDKLTTSQKKGITITDRDLCVVAGPGSGKTRVLVERFVYLVTTGKASTNEILTLTFTEKAANEMKIRVASLFEQKGMEKERQEIEFAYLSTIHGFCSRLLRENAIEAGIDPQFRVMDELESNRLKEQTLDTVLKKWTNENRVDAFLNNISWKQIDAKGSRVKTFKESLIHLHDKIRNACQPIPEIVKAANIYSNITNSRNKIDAIVSEIKAIHSEQKLTDKTVAKIKEILYLWNNSPLQNNINELNKKNGDASLSLLREIKDIWSITKGNVSKVIKQSLQELKEELESLIGLVTEDYATGFKMVLRDFLIDFDNAYSEKKKSEGLADFTDLEEKTITLLRENDYVTSEIKQRFKYMLVDEFQDTSRLQKSIIDLVRGKDNLFIVGDEKQSIYSFRNADVEIFRGVQNEVNKSSLIYLNENFRSRPQILSFINHIFSNIWPNNISDQQKDCNEDHSLKPGASFSQKAIPSVEMIMTAGEDKAQARKWESIEVAKRIKEIVEKGEIEITNERENKRNLSYKDFVILFRSTSDIKLYERSLAAFDIPYYVVSGRGFFSTSEITDLINLLKVLESPLDEINLASVLKSPFVGIDDEALFWLSDYAHNNSERKYISHILGKVDDIKEIKSDDRNKITQFLKLLKEIQNIKPRTSLWGLISFILEKTEFQSKMLLFSNGKRRFANLLKLIELCRSLEEFGAITLKDFIEIVEGYKFREVRESEAPVESEEEDVVKLTTVHAAKGLEFPVVILADIDRGRANQSDYFVYSKDQGISFKICNPLTQKDEIPLSYKKIIEEVNEKDQQELKRLLYVAMTRAQEHLIISGGISMGSDDKVKIKGDWIKDIFAALDLSHDLKENPEIINLNGNDHMSGPADEVNLRFTSVTSESKPTIESERKKLLTQHRKEINACSTIKTSLFSDSVDKTGKEILSTIRHTVPVDQSHYVYTVTEILKFHFCPQLYYLNYVLGLQSKTEILMYDPGSEEDINMSQDDEIPGSELGSIAHQVFNKYNVTDGQKELQEIIKKEFDASGFDMNNNNIDLVASWVNSFYKSDVGNEAVASSTQKRETSFIFKYQDNLIRGQIDLFYFINKDSLKIVDYKANDISAKEIPEKVKYYQLQMQLYAKALEAIYEKKVEETMLYFLVPNQSVVIDTTKDSCQKLYETLDMFFEAHKDNAFTKTRKHKCKWCEFEKICK